MGTFPLDSLPIPTSPSHLPHHTTRVASRHFSLSPPSLADTKFCEMFSVCRLSQQPVHNGRRHSRYTQSMSPEHNHTVSTYFSGGVPGIQQTALACHEACRLQIPWKLDRRLAGPRQ
eukprot:GHVQ01023921.1.p1 GENE.GHVQ01023921.1~~GHVQ01023921.1.p1  ORF type:complete len:117 (+),score=7.03 GHVQ01023921.1:342-692(+)